MKIVKLTAENFMRLVAVEITPKGNAIMITGKNAQGKSSILDAIMSVFCGKKYMPQEPIRKGQERAEVVVETDNYIIKRTFTAKGGGSVTVSNAEGMKATSPQGLLDKMVGEIAFDAEIAKLKQQRSAVKSSKETYDFEAGKIVVPEDTPGELLVMTELTNKLSIATKHNQEQADVAKKIGDYDNKISALSDSITANTELIASLEEKLSKAKQAKTENETTKTVAKEEQEKLAETLEPLINIEAINTEIAEADAKNENVRKVNQKKQLQKKSAGKVKEYAELGKKVKTEEAKKAKRLKAAEMPIDGLSVNEETILYDDGELGAIPLSQVNESQQLQIAVGISMACNPKLRVILMKGNDLDQENLEAVCKMAEEKDYQVWIEKVSDDKKNKTGFIIEDGSVVEADKDADLFTEKE